MKVKKLIAGLLMAAFLMTTSVVASSDSAGFDDVDYSHDNYDAIQYLKTEGIVEGYSDGNFKPDITINRAEFLKIVMEASDYELKGVDCYPDVKDQWFAKYVCKATELGLVQGYPDGWFRPEKEINFVEASKIIVNTLKLEKAEIDSDVWYEEYVSVLEGGEAIPKSIEAFDHKVTRGEMSEMIWRVKEKPEYVTATSYRGIERKVAAAESGGELQSFESCADLGGYLEDNVEPHRYDLDYMMEDMAMPMTAAPTTGAVEEAAPDETKAAESMDSGLGSGSDDYSTTNVQVEGVDEADIVKNDGQYIYLLKGDTVRVVRAYPPGSMTELDAVTFDDPDFYPSDMYLDEGRLVVIGYTYGKLDDIVVPLEDESESIMPYYYDYETITKVYIFDINDKANITLMRELSFEGDYSSSRKVDEMVYVVLNKYEYYYELPEKWDEPDILPLYGDSATGMIEPVTTCGDVWYWPWVESTEYLVVAGIPIDNAKAQISEEVILGSSGDIYASRDNLYVAESKYSWYGWDEKDEETVIHKFKLGRDDMGYLGNGDVPGTILNQFSMDEHNGYFRIATTLGDLWDEDNPSTNNLYILSSELEQVGQIEGIAPGEKIYSVRFMGRRAYIVTFKKVDPFFVIDVADPKHPQILGKLKIPGYSDYLHPYDDDHIIGFGKEALDASEEEISSRSLDFAWYQGMKVAMFDVTDVANPKELHKVVIGDRGTDSELLWNHKALLFDKDKGLMAFPVTLAELSEDVKNNPDTADNTYGDYTYQGAYVYDVSIEDGFNLRGRITHYKDNEVEDLSGYYWYGDKDISRILYIGEYLYTISQSIVQANGMDDLEFVEKVNLGN